MKKNILYLASQSSSRKLLLEKTGIDFKILDQNADESQCDWGMPLQKVVESIAEHKMKHVIMPQAIQGEIAFVLTADTLGIDTTGAITGKPVDMADAIAKVKAAQNGVNHCGTAFCLEKKVFDAGQWKTEKKIIGYAQASYEFNVPDSLIEEYIKQSGALACSGAVKIEAAPQFLKSVDGSYTAIRGLPMYELWQALEKIGFFFLRDTPSAFLRMK